MAAKQSGYSEEVFADADEKASSSLLYSMVMGNHGFGTHVPGLSEMPINDKLFIIQSDIIKKAASEGSCVIIGRCADYILRDFDNCLNVFIHAPKEDRVKRIVGKNLCEPKKAPDFVTKKDKQRANYYNFYSNNRWDDLSNYDLTVDAAKFTVDGAVELIAEAARRLDK